jgi:hypothetical protein
MDIKINDLHRVVDAKAILGDGSVIPLEAKPERQDGLARCHFFEPFKVGEFEIRLRMDWGKEKDRSEGKDPTLDANIFKNGVELKKQEQWHNTDRKPENGVYVYTWEPEIEGLKSLRISFKLQTTHQRDLTAKANIKT